MNHVRFSLAKSLGAMTLAALAMGAVTTQSAFLTNALFTCFWCILFLAVIGTRAGSPAQRRFWLGFALCGWTYWFVGFDTTQGRGSNSRSYPLYVSSYYSSSTRPIATEQTRLITSNIIDWLEDHITTNHRVGSHVAAVWRRSSLYPGVIMEVTDGGDGIDEYLIRWDDGSPDQWTARNEVFPDSSRARIALHCFLGMALSLIVGWLGLFCFPIQESDKSTTSVQTR